MGATNYCMYMRLSWLLALATAAAVAATTCEMSPADPQYKEYVANASVHVPGWDTVDLDLPPRERWQKLVAPHAQDIASMLDTFKSEGGPAVQRLVRLAEMIFGGAGRKLLDALPSEYADEIEGIASATGISALDLFVYNIMYEFSGACTSIVAQDATGHIIHGRNLDFGPAPLAAKLRPLLRNVQFVKGGRVVFRSTSYLGYVGCLTCVKKGSFSATVNTRFWNKLPTELAEWILGVNRSGQFLTFMIRDAFEKDADFATAVQRINTTRLLGPAYVIVGGVNAGEGAVVTRSANESLHFWSLQDEVARGTPYVLETNFDHWDGKPHDRRDDGNACMDRIVGAADVSFEGVFRVLSARPNRNTGTTYTSLMSGLDGRLESYVQHCCAESEDLLVV